MERSLLSLQHGRNADMLKSIAGCEVSPASLNEWLVHNHTAWQVCESAIVSAQIYVSEPY